MKRFTADEVKVGFIGLGNMGSRIAHRLLEHEYQVCVYDVDRTKAETMAAQGGVVAGNIIDLARTVDVVLSCLTNDEMFTAFIPGQREFLPEYDQEPWCWR
jgi:3-hydroxyisobutyrate dehydrogenase